MFFTCNASCSGVVIVTDFKTKNLEYETSWKRDCYLRERTSSICSTG